MKQGSIENVLNKNSEIIEELEEVPIVERRDDNYDFRFVNIDDSVSIYLLRKGNGIPMILLNGGPGNSCHSFIPYFDNATEFCEVIMYDPRGVGKSDWKPGPGYSTKQLVDDLEKIRKKLGIKKWVIAGWSFGGLAAQHYLLKYPNNVLGIVLINSSYSANYEFDDTSYPNHLTEKEKLRIREIYSIDGNKVVPTHSDQVSLKMMQKMVYNGYLNGDWKRQFFYKPSKKEMAAVALYEWNHDKDYNRLVAKDGFDKNLSSKFLENEIPVILFYGKYDMTFSSDLAEKMKNEFPNSKLVMMNNSSHNPFKEETELFFNELENFVLSIEFNRNN